MLTQCSHCQVIFRINESQLETRQGMVRCGGCMKVFNAAWNLLEDEDKEPLPQEPTSETTAGERTSEEKISLPVSQLPETDEDSTEHTLHIDEAEQEGVIESTEDIAEAPEPSSEPVVRVATEPDEEHEEDENVFISPHKNLQQQEEDQMELGFDQENQVSQPSVWHTDSNDDEVEEWLEDISDLETQEPTTSIRHGGPGTTATHVLPEEGDSTEETRESLELAPEPEALPSDEETNPTDSDYPAAKEDSSMVRTAESTESEINSDLIDEAFTDDEQTNQSYYNQSENEEDYYDDETVDETTQDDFNQDTASRDPTLYSQRKFDLYDEEVAQAEASHPRSPRLLSSSDSLRLPLRDDPTDRRLDPKLPGSNGDLIIDEEEPLDINAVNWVVMRERSPFKIGLIIGCIVLFAGLAYQTQFMFLKEIAQIETMRPALAYICNITGCELPPKTDVNQITLAQTQIDLHPEVPGALRITAKLVNRAEFAQPFPPLQLTLTDRVGRIVGRRAYPVDVYLDGDSELALLQPEMPREVTLNLAQPVDNAVGFEVTLLEHL